MTVRSRRTLRLAAAALVLSGTGILGTATAASAGAGCGEYSFGFEGTRLLNDGISNTAGPFTISMPAGTYDITLHSFDDHVDHPGQTEQTQEQWYFTLDSGYTSPVSSDVPDDAVSVTDTFSSQTIGEASSITVRHLGEGNVNSVSPMCIGFTTVSVEVPPVVEEVPEGPVVDPPVVVAPVVVAPVVEVPVVEGPLEVVPAKEVSEVEEVSVEVKPAVEIKAPVAAAPLPAPAPQLAVTGASAHTWVMIFSGAALVALGVALVFEERRRSLNLLTSRS